jgi:hypothetical protein
LPQRVRTALNRAFADLAYERTVSGWRSVQQPSTELAALDQHAFVADEPRRVIALHRNTWVDPTLLSNLVAVTMPEMNNFSPDRDSATGPFASNAEAFPTNWSTVPQTVDAFVSAPQPAEADDVLGAAAGWLDVAVIAAEQLRTAEGSPEGVQLGDHSCLREEWPVGARLRAEVVAAVGNELSLRAVAVLGPIATHPLHIDPAADGGNVDGELNDGEVEEPSAGEIVALTATDTPPVAEADIVEYFDLESIEVNDDEDAEEPVNVHGPVDEVDLSVLLSADFHSGSEELLAASYSTSASVEEPPVTVRPPTIRPPVSVTLPQLEVLARFVHLRPEGMPAIGAVLSIDIVGYDGSGSGRVVLVADPVDGEADEAQNTDPAGTASLSAVRSAKSRRRSYDLSAQERVIVLDTLVGWGASAALVCTESRLRAIVDAAEFDLSGHDHDICELLTPGEILKVCPTVRGDWPTFSLRPRLAVDLLNRPRARVGSRQVFAATVTEVAADGSFVVATLDGGRPEPGLAHRFRLRRRLLDRATVEPVVGTRVGLNLATDDDRAKVRLPDPPVGLTNLCVRSQGRLRYTDDALQVVRREPLPDRLTTSLLELDSDPEWSRLVWQLWESRMPTRIMSVQSLPDDIELITSPPRSGESGDSQRGRQGKDAGRQRARVSLPPPPGRHQGIVREVQDRALRINVAGWVGTLPAHQIGREGLTDLGRWMPAGTAVTVTATTNTGANGPPVRLSAKDHPVPDLLDQLLVLVGSTWTGPVVGETGGGLFVQLFPGLRQVRAYLPKAEVGDDAGRLLAAQAEVTVRITQARMDRGRLQVKVTLDRSS